MKTGKRLRLEENYSGVDGEILSEDSITEPYYIGVKEQVERMVLAGQQLIDYRKYQYKAHEEVPDDILLANPGMDIVDLYRMRDEVVKRLVLEERSKNNENGGTENEGNGETGSTDKDE